MTSRRGLLLAAIVAVGSVLAGSPGGPPPAVAECEPAGPDPRIEDHRGFAFEGVVESIVGRREVEEGWVDRITIGVTEVLAGDPGSTVAFDTGRGPCSLLQGNRFKVGDRLIVTASAPPSARPMASFGSAWVWRYEWDDRWTFHGYQRRFRRVLDRAITRPTTRDGVLALVAPDRLGYRIDPDAWRPTLERRDLRILDLVAWRDGFVALGSDASILVSETGDAWAVLPDPFGAVAEVGRPDRIVVFRDVLFAFGLHQTRLVAWRSTNAGTWSPVDGGPAFATPVVAYLGERTPQGVEQVGTGEALVVLIARSAWVSQDGVTWSTGVTSGLVPIRGDPVATSAGFLMAQCLCGQPDPVNAQVRSDDGLAWEPAGEVPGGLQLVVDPTRDRLLAAALDREDDGDRRAGVDVSADGVAWARMLTAPGTIANHVTLAAAGDAIALLVSDYTTDRSRSWTMISDDAGRTWTRSPIRDTRPAECVERIAIGTTRIVAVGACGAVRAWVADR